MTDRAEEIAAAVLRRESEFMRESYGVDDEPENDILASNRLAAVIADEIRKSDAANSPVPSKGELYR